MSYRLGGTRAVRVRANCAEPNAAIVCSSAGHRKSGVCVMTSHILLENVLSLGGQIITHGARNGGGGHADRNQRHAGGGEHMLAARLVDSIPR